LDREELSECVERVRLVGVTAFMIDYLADASLNRGSFGRAMVVSQDSKVIESKALEREGTLLFNEGHPP